MSIDHDLQNLAPLANEDREALESGYVAMANSTSGNPPGPLSPEEIIKTLKGVVGMTRLVAFAIEGINFDGSEEIRHAIYRHAEDPLYDLIAKLEGRTEEAEVAHG